MRKDLAVAVHLSLLTVMAACTADAPTVPQAAVRPDRVWYRSNLGEQTENTITLYSAEGNITLNIVDRSLNFAEGSLTDIAPDTVNVLASAFQRVLDDEPSQVEAALALNIPPEDTAATNCEIHPEECEWEQLKAPRSNPEGRTKSFLDPFGRQTPTRRSIKLQRIGPVFAYGDPLCGVLSQQMAHYAIQERVQRDSLQHYLRRLRTNLNNAPQSDLTRMLTLIVEHDAARHRTTNEFLKAATAEFGRFKCWSFNSPFWREDGTPPWKPGGGGKMRRGPSIGNTDSTIGWICNSRLVPLGDGLALVETCEYMFAA